MPDFGFVGDAYTAPSIYQDAQELINWYCEIDTRKPNAAADVTYGTQSTRGVIALYPTPGFGAPLVSLNAAEVRGLHTMSGGATL